MIPHASDACLSKDKNDQDAFVDQEGALEIVVRSRKPKAVELTNPKELIRLFVEELKKRQKAIKEKMIPIDEKDMQLALEQEHARQLALLSDKCLAGSCVRARARCLKAETRSTVGERGEELRNNYHCEE